MHAYTVVTSVRICRELLACLLAQCKFNNLSNLDWICVSQTPRVLLANVTIQALPIQPLRWLG